MICLTNLASFKRALAVPGVVFTVVSHWQEHLVGTTRTPAKVQTNGYWFDAPNSSGKIVRMYSQLPKASDLAFSEGRVIFYPNSPRSWTLSLDAPEVQS